MTLYTPSSDRIVHETSVDFKKRTVNEHIHIVQYDQSLPIVAVSLYADFVPYIVPENADVNIRIKKLDGTFIYNRALGWNSERTVVYFEISHQIAIAYGILTPVVEIKIGRETAASGAIIIEVDKNPVQDGDIESTNEYTVIEDYLAEAEDAATRAKNSASEAATSESNALASEKKAKTSENNAKKSETNAKNSEDNAKESETNAKDSEEKALASQKAAKTSEDNALASEKKAKTSEDNAKKSETNAKNSEDNAKESETNAKDSEEKALASQKAAKASEDNAAESEENATTAKDAAETAAGSAADSAGAAKTSETNAKKSEDNTKASETNAEKSADAAATSASEAEDAANRSETFAGNAEDSANRAEEIAVELGKINDRIPKFVSDLPEAGDERYLYVVVKDADHNLFDLYVWVDDKWVHMGGENIIFPTYLKVPMTLKASKWSNKSQTKEITHELLTDPLTDDDDIIVYPFDDCADEYFDYGISVRQNGNSIVFSCKIVPTSDLNFMVLVHLYCEIPTPVGYYDKKQIDEDVVGLTSSLKTTEKANVVAAINELYSQKYVKPTNGIPETDMAEAVTKALALARTALQSIPLATDSNLGGVKVGYSESGKNYAVKLAEGKMYVSVPWTDTHYASHIYVGASGVASHGAETNPYIKLYDNSTARESFKISGGGSVTVKSDASGNITISGVNTTYSNGVGLTLTGGVFAHESYGEADTYGSTTNETLKFGGTFTIPYFETNAQGHVVSAGTRTVTMPANPNSDTWRQINVQNSAGTSLGSLGTGTGTGALTLKAGSNVTLEFASGVVTIKSSFTNTTYSAGTGITFSGTTINHKNSVTEASDVGGASGGTVDFGKTFTVPYFSYDAQGHIVGSGVKTYTLPANPNTDTHYTTHLYVGATGAASNAATTNGNTYIKLYDNSTARESFKISGGGSVTVKSDASGNITISGVNTTYSNGVGLTLTGGVFAHESYGEADTYGSTTNETLKFGGTFTIPYFETNAQGHVVSAGTRTVTMPANPNSDTWRQINVQNSAGTSLGSLGTGTGTGALTLKAGSNVTLEFASGVVTIKSSFTNTTYSAGTGITFSGTTINHKNSVTEASDVGGASGGTVDFGKTFTVPYFSYDAQGHIVGSGVKTYTLPANPNTDTHYTTHLYVGATGAASNAATTNGNTYIKLYDNSTARESHKISGTQNVTVTSDASGNIVITGPDLSAYAKQSWVTTAIINSQDYSISGTNTSMGVTANYGTVKRPASTDKSKFLRGDNTWVEIEAPEISKPISVTISASSWSSSNTVTLSSTNNSGIKNVSTSSYIEVSPDLASAEAYQNATIRATSLGSGTITLTAAKKPTASITVQILIL